MGDPTRPTQPLGAGSHPPRREVVEREVVPPEPDPLLEEVRRIRFWAFFGAGVGTVAAILAVVALIAALSNDDSQGGGNVNAGDLSALRSDVGNLRSDMGELRSSVQDTSEQVDSLSNRIRRLEQSGDQSNVEDELSQLQQDISELTDRVDQIERAQEEAASGGP